MDLGENIFYDILPSFRSVKDFERNPIFFRFVTSTYLSFRQVQNCWNWIQIVGKAANVRRGVYECIEFLSMYRIVFRYIKNFRDLKSLKAKTLNTQTSREVFIRLVVMFSMNSFCMKKFYQEVLVSFKPIREKYLHQTTPCVGVVWNMNHRKQLMVRLWLN